MLITSISLFSQHFSIFLTLHHIIPTFNDPEEEALENTVGKGENAGNKHFSFSLSVFYSTEGEIIISATFI